MFLRSFRIYALILALSLVYSATYSKEDSAIISHSGPNNPYEEIFRKRRSPSFYNTYGFYSNLLVSSHPPNDFMKEWLTREHNRCRRIVPASDMRLLYWSDELARSAQRHANRCDFRHSRDRVNVGENIWAAPYSNYSEAISLWFDEVYDPRCDCQHAYKHCCGHYVQVVWANTNLVGCGYAKCRDIRGVMGRGHQHIFVCHYNPQGNTVFITQGGKYFAVPAFTWAISGKRCSKCPEDAPACFNGLCYTPLNDVEPEIVADETFNNFYNLNNNSASIIND